MHSQGCRTAPGKGYEQGRVSTHHAWEDLLRATITIECSKAGRHTATFRVFLHAAAWHHNGGLMRLDPQQVSKAVQCGGCSLAPAEVSRTCANSHSARPVGSTVHVPTVAVRGVKRSSGCLMTCKGSHDVASRWKG
ncbi:hypothetical protein IG631_22487 [Alternaria alternata]|nr:hypothetical protein IG631_22487 [Alternaria alternata]